MLAHKDHPLSMRFPAGDLATIDRAAAARGRSRTDFVREAAVRAAEETLVETTLIRMEGASFAAFVSAIDASPQSVPELVELFRRSPPWAEG